MTKIQYIHINSEIDRMVNDLSTSTWTSYLSSPILISNSSEVRISLEACEIPNVLYNFGSDSSIFWFYLDPLGVNTLVGIQIPVNRNWTDGNAFIASMNALLTSAGYANLVFSFDSNTNRITITNNLAQTIQIVKSYRYGVNNLTYNSSIDKLGYTQNITTNIVSGASIEAQSILRLLRTNCYYLTCENVASSTKESVIPNPYRQGDKIIGRITAGNFGSLSQLQFLPASNIQVANQSITNFKFTLLDDNLSPIYDMYSPITLTLKVSIL